MEANALRTGRAAVVLTGVIAAFLAAAAQSQQPHAIRQSVGLQFHYGVVPAELVLRHPDQHPERQMHGKGAAPRGSHLVLALFEAQSGKRVSIAEVSAHVTLAGGPSVTRRLEPMKIAEQPSFGAFVPIGAPGIYRIRFEVKRPGVERGDSAEFEHRVPGPERGR
jgi:hypothetical protein